MLTLKVITEETDQVIRGLEKEHFKGCTGKHCKSDRIER